MLPASPRPPRRVGMAVAIAAASLVPFVLGILSGRESVVGAGVLAGYLLAFILAGRLRN